MFSPLVLLKWTSLRWRYKRRFVKEERECERERKRMQEREREREISDQDGWIESPRQHLSEVI